MTTSNKGVAIELEGGVLVADVGTHDATAVIISYNPTEARRSRRVI